MLIEDAHCHGVVRVGFARALSLVQRLVRISLSEISWSPADYQHPAIAGYENRIVDQSGFDPFFKIEDEEVEDRRRAFLRGDRCVATFVVAVEEEDAAEEIVGYNFYTDLPTVVDAETEFFFPDRFLYSYAAYTALEHRGRRLSPSRWGFFRAWQESTLGSILPTISYVEMTNLSSLASGGGSHRFVIGYAGHIRIFGRIGYWASPGCRRIGAGFRARPADQSPV